MSGNRPGEGDIVAVTANGKEVQRYSDFISLPGMTGDLEALALYAGQSAGLISRIQPAKEIITDLVNEAKQAVQHLKTIC
jgi:NAD(P)H-dependent flavin oxidoreductase YrpB (nitropropane dioxygenase family)